MGKEIKPSMPILSFGTLEKIVESRKSKVNLVKINELSDVPKLAPFADPTNPNYKIKFICDIDGVIITKFNPFSGMLEGLKHFLKEKKAESISPEQNFKAKTCKKKNILSNLFESNMQAFWALKRILRDSRIDKVHFSSGRPNIGKEEGLSWKMVKHLLAGPITNFPFFTQETTERLTEFPKKTAGEEGKKREVTLNSGLSKVFRKDPTREFAEQQIKLLQEDKTRQIVIVGSGAIDRKNLIALIKLANEKHIPLDRVYYFDTGKMII